MHGVFDFVPDYEADETGVERSLFIRLVHFFKRSRPEVDEIEPLLKVRKAILSRSVFWLQDKDLLQLGAGLAAEVSHWDMARASCRDLVTEKEAQRHLCGSLRYCPTCLHSGWHSSLFQHWVLPICPLHGDRLTTGCPGCGEEIVANLIVLARAQMTCDHCACIFERHAGAKGNRDTHKYLPASAFVAYRQALPQRFAYVEETDRRLVSISDARTSADLRGRALQRFQAWPELPLKGYRHWSLAIYEYERKRLDPPLVDISIVESRVAKTLQEIAAMLREAGCWEDCPPALQSRSHVGARLDSSISLVAAAYWKTAHMYRIANYLTTNGSGTLPRIAHFGYACFASPDAWEETLRFEVFGLAVATLLQLRHFRFLIEVDWEHHAPPETFLPAWRLFQEQSKWKLEVRPKANVDTLPRLIRRYAHRRLLEVPKDQALLARLAEMDRDRKMEQRGCADS